MKESVIIVNKSGQAIGTMDKMAAHTSGTLHRAFSVFVFNSQGQLLLQQRALDKYHSGGLWTNTCCSHPQLGENTLKGAHRRLQEEMGMDCELAELFQFTYEHKFENGLTEHEYDHVFLGQTNQLPQPNAIEVAAYKYMNVDQLVSAMINQPDEYTPWFKICFEQVLTNYHQINNL